MEAKRWSELEVSRGAEWLVTDGRGGYALGTVNQMLTRRYHGLLVAAVVPPLERYVLLAKLDATVVLDGLTYELGTNEYGGAVQPRGYQLLESFTTRPCPTWRWRVGKAVVEQRLCMMEGESATFVSYRLLEGPERVALYVRPLCTSRHAHHLTKYEQMGPPTVDAGEQMVRIQFGQGRPSVGLSHNGEFRPRGDWYYGFVLAEEAARGYEAVQDLFTPGLISGTLRRGEETGLVIAASMAGRSWEDWRGVFEENAEEDARGAACVGVEDRLAVELGRGTKVFVVSRGERATILAGYPWFGDWGRDTFISLPGICLATGRLEEARGILETFAGHVDGGMLPNVFDDYGGPPQYESIDAPLWFIHAADRFLAYSGDWGFGREVLYPKVREIVEAYRAGTRFGIRADADGLLMGGEEGHALTWMDAKVNGRAVTARIGKPVEINALWFNALRIAAEYADRAGEVEQGEAWRALGDRARISFNARYWNEEAGCLYDVVDVDGRAGAVSEEIRPNQLLAISLNHPVLEKGRWRAVVDVCRERLYTPVGMRTLAPGSAGYRGRYEGDPAARDSGYHQGAAWAWLLGPFVSAFVRAYGDNAMTRATARSFLDGLPPHLSEAGLGGVSELFDGDPPHSARGCPWQAWSVGEPLRALCEDVLKTHPAVPREQGRFPAVAGGAAGGVGVGGRGLEKRRKMS